MKRISKGKKLFKETLSKEFFSRTEKNTRYSLRAFAKKLGVSPTTISEVLSGKRQVSLATCRRVLSKLNIDQRTEKAVLESWSEPDFVDIENQVKKTRLYCRLFSIFSILAFIETSAYDGSFESITTGIGLPVAEVKKILEEMAKIGIVHFEKERYVPTGKKYSIGGKKIQVALKTITETSLIETYSFINSAENQFRFEKSDLSIMFVPVSTSRIAEAKERIKKFRRSLAKFLESDKGELACMLAINFVPLSGWRKGSSAARSEQAFPR